MKSAEPSSAAGLATKRKVVADVVHALATAARDGLSFAKVYDQLLRKAPSLYDAMVAPQLAQDRTLGSFLTGEHRSPARPPSGCVADQAAGVLWISELAAVSPSSSMRPTHRSGNPTQANVVVVASLRWANSD
jgi:hypothetical protein